MKAENGHRVSVHYRGTLIDGTEFDNSRVRGETLNFDLGSGTMIEGFNNAIVGMAVGDSTTVVLQPEEAYGNIDPEALRPAPKSAFGPDFEFVVGEVVQGNGPQGTFLAKIHEIRDEDVVLNLNHPLAGEQLTFEIELMEIVTGAETVISTVAESGVTMANWNSSMKKAELLEVAKSRGLPVNTRSTKAQIIDALQAQ